VVVTTDLTDVQVRRLFEVIDTSTGAGLLHRAVLGVLFSTGIAITSSIFANFYGCIVDKKIALKIPLEFLYLHS